MTDLLGDTIQLTPSLLLVVRSWAGFEARVRCDGRAVPTSENSSEEGMAVAGQGLLQVCFHVPRSPPS